MKDVKLSDGFTMKLDETALDDMELLDLVADMYDGSPTAQSKIFKKIFGDAKKDLYAHLRDEKGRVPKSKVEEAFMEVLDALRGKN